MAVEEWYKRLREESEQFMRENQRQWDDRQREWNEQRRIADERRRTESQIAVADMEANVQKLGSKLESKFEALIELIRSMNGNSPAGTGAGGGVVDGGARVIEESQGAPKSADSQDFVEQEIGFDHSLSFVSWKLEEGAISDAIGDPNLPVMDGTKGQEKPIQEVATVPQISGDFTEPEISFDYSLPSVYWKLEEGAISKAIEAPKLPVIVGIEEQEKQRSNIVAGMQWLQEGIGKPSLQVLELAKVKSGSSETPSVDYISANLGGLVELLIELMEIRLANANKISRTGLRMDSTVSLRNLISAHKVFAKMTDYTVVLFESKKCLGQLKSDRNLALDEQCCYLDLARGMVLVYDPGGDFDVLECEIGGCRIIDMGSTGVVDYNSSTDALFSLQCFKDRLILMPFDRGRSTAIPIGLGGVGVDLYIGKRLIMVFDPGGDLAFLFVLPEGLGVCINSKKQEQWLQRQLCNVMWESK